jgi:hypothetical protein
MTNDDYIEQSQKEMMRLRRYEKMVHFIAADYLELSFHKADIQRNDWRHRCKRLIEEDYGSSDQLVDQHSDQLVDPILNHYHNMTNGQNN